MAVWVAGSIAVVGIGGIIAGSISGGKANDLAQDNADLTAEIARENLLFQKDQQKKLDKQKSIYRAMEFKNPYSNIENVYEDLTVNKQQAQFQAQQGDQQRANIMQQMKGAAGGSGVASLAQVMANQGQLQTQKISASIGMQEARNQELKARGAGAADLQERAGESSLQTMEMDRQATLLGISMGESAGANAASMQAQQNQLSAGAAQANLYGQQAASYADAGSSMISAGMSYYGAGSS